jgi:hypothetical protein
MAEPKTHELTPIYVAMSIHAWGVGSTPGEARSRCLRAGASRTEKMIIKRLPLGARDAEVDNYGTIMWEGAAGKVETIETYNRGRVVLPC